jgi:cytochrome c
MTRASIAYCVSGVLAAAFAGVLPALAATALPPGNAAHGKELYQECRGCHAVNATLVGPKHCGVYGRKAGSVEGYVYSDVMKRSGITWDDAHLDAFLTSPFTYLSGTNMGYVGIDNPQDRADVIAYLKEAMDPKNCDATEADQKAHPLPTLGGSASSGNASGETKSGGN